MRTGREGRYRAPTHNTTPTPFYLCTVWPSRGGWPVLGQALELADGAPWDVMTRWARAYGKIYQFPLFGHVNVVLSDPAYMREVMRTKVRGTSACLLLGVLRCLARAGLRFTLRRALLCAR